MDSFSELFGIYSFIVKSLSIVIGILVCYFDLANVFFFANSIHPSSFKTREVLSFIPLITLVFFLVHKSFTCYSVFFFQAFEMGMYSLHPLEYSGNLIKAITMTDIRRRLSSIASKYYLFVLSNKRSMESCMWLEIAISALYTSLVRMASMISICSDGASFWSISPLT